MIKDGFYRTELNGPFGKGVGVVHILDGAVKGADDLMIYSGAVNVSPSGAVSGQVVAMVYVPSHNQKGQKFEVTCTGTAAGESFALRGKYLTGELVEIKGEFVAGPEL